MDVDSIKASLQLKHPDLMVSDGDSDYKGDHIEVGVDSDAASCDTSDLLKPSPIYALAKHLPGEYRVQDRISHASLSI